MVQRYNPDYVMHAARFEPFARENEHGELVKFSDYEVLKAERDAARNALASIYKTVTGELPEWSNWHAYLDDIVEEVGAAVADIQAQGVEKLADKLDAEIEQIMRGAFFYDEISSREAISKMVREFATELREAK
ncbi:hypothetical protein SM12BL3_14220 [Serratia marcescens]|nr:hypothetical protein SM12BL3_14220 [Serratia marcescens]